MLKTNWLLKVRRNTNGYVFAKLLPSFFAFAPVVWLILACVLIGTGFAMYGDAFGLIKKIPKKNLLAIAVAVLAIPIPYILFYFSRISKARLQLYGDTLYIRGTRFLKTFENNYNISEIETIEIGSTPSQIQRFLQMVNPLAGKLSHKAKPGQIYFYLRTGEKNAYSYFDLVYDYNSVLDILMELRRRGINVTGIRF
jgi:hypothetical protein